jgi:pyrimidine operon attenuation protein/uracil phosphoribosyltransferase
MATDRYRLYSERDLEPVIDGMARQAAGLLDGTPTVLLGMLRRGAPLADRLLARLKVHAPGAVLGRLDVKVKRYADNLELLHPDTALEPPVAADLAGRRVIVVDDVLYQGWSLFRVFEWLAGLHPAAVHAAVLVDRQRHRLPVRADVVGVTLKIAPYETDFAVDLWRPGGER